MRNSVLWFLAILVFGVGCILVGIGYQKWRNETYSCEPVIYRNTAWLNEDGHLIGVATTKGSHITYIGSCP